ncbi:hypothetical protein COB64_00725 [Candidatus Wolfebacteria bacterium]|nr:MAG: hypothetical protein COB64_00725 [Candidatus Wolfebacteria bacterium]
MNHLLEFYGKECPHCVRMHDLIEQLEKELDISVDAFEVWHDKENQKKMEEYDKELCGGVPFFFNTKSKQFICGEVDYDKLKEWAQSE